MLSGLQKKSTVPSLLGQHQALELAPSCILGPFASHQRLLQDILRGNCPDRGARSEVRPSQGRAAEARGQRQALVDPMGSSVIPSLWGVLGGLGLRAQAGGSKGVSMPAASPG